MDASEPSGRRKRGDIRGLFVEGPSRDEHKAVSRPIDNVYAMR